MLLLNAVPVEVSGPAGIQVGILPYDADDLRRLRAEWRGVHFFKRDGERSRILAIPLTGQAPPEGERDTFDLATEARLAAPLVEEALMRLFRGLGRKILSRWPLKLLGSERHSVFATNQNQVPDWIQRRLMTEFATRVVRREGRPPLVLLACDVKVRNSVNATCAELLTAGVDLKGRYVGVFLENDDPRLERRFRLVGRVAAVRRGSLELEDHADGFETIETGKAFLESRAETVDWCLRQVLGRRADAVLRDAETKALAWRNGPGKLDQIKKSLDWLRKQNLYLCPGITFRLGPLASSDSRSWFPTIETYDKPLLVFDPSGSKTSKWNQGGLDSHGPYDGRTFSPRELKIAVVCQANCEGQFDGFLAKFLDGLPHVKRGGPGRETAPYEKGFLRRFGLKKPMVHVFTASDATSEAYLRACRAALETATDGNFKWHLAFVQIDDIFKTTFGNQNPYLVTKAFFLRHQIPVQEVKRETIRQPDGSLVYTLNNISLAAYAKIGGTPWLLKAQPTVAHELVIGIGSHTVMHGRIGTGERTVGITTVFSSDGRYLLDDRTTAVEYDQYAEALQETLRRSIETVRRQDAWRSSDQVRLVFHIFKPLKDREAQAVAKTVESLGFSDVTFAFLHIVDNHPFVLFDDSKPSDGKGAFAPDRGIKLDIADGETLVCLKGAREVKEARHGMPEPSLLRLHRLSTFRDMDYLSRQVFDFSCHSWRMLSPSPVPITVLYSDLIASLLTNLREVADWDEDTMLTAIARTRWFL